MRSEPHPRRRGQVLGLAAAAASIVMALADVPQARAETVNAASVHTGSLDVPLNKSEIVSSDVAIVKAMIGNDDIADVLPVSSRSIYVLGKKMGTTSLTLYGPGGQVISVLDISVGPDADSLRKQLLRFLPGELIDARISNDSIVLSGMVSDPGAVGRAMQIARTYAGDKVVNLLSVGSSQQVMLEVRFAEVDRSSGFDVGANFSGRSNTGRFQGITGAGSGFVPAVPGTVSTSVTNGISTITSSGGVPAYLSTTAISGAFGVFRQSFGIGGLAVDAMLNALETKGLAKTLAQPTLVAISGERASFLAGGEFPVPVAQSASLGSSSNNAPAITVQFKPFGVSLGFTPTVLSDKTISLVVEPEVSSIDPTASITVGNIAIPGIRTRRASTTVELRDGESFALAGLLQQDFKTSINQLPLLGSLPILGSLFRSTNYQKGQTELLIVVTPHLVAPIRREQIHLPTDATGDPTAVGAILLGQPAPPRAPEATKREAPTDGQPQGAAAAPGQAPDAARKPAGSAELPAATQPAKKGSNYEY